ncbi:hypothetical protein LTR85_004376 [Meristemomyces frigidus]|nr:hypothetical protein LTR85_004376 [Meristemomyces frigidus]
MAQVITAATALTERNEAMRAAALAWQKLVLIDDTAGAARMERAGEDTFGEEVF